VRAWAAMLAAAVAATERAVCEGVTVARVGASSEVSAGGEGGRDDGEKAGRWRWREEAWIVEGGRSLEAVRWLRVGEGGLEVYRPGLLVNSETGHTVKTSNRILDTLWEALSG